MSDVNETVNLWYGHLSMLLVAGDRLDTVTYLQEKEQLVGNALREVLAEWDEVPERLREAVTYSLLAGGKRLRPILLLTTCEALGGEEEVALAFACALEMIHTYSLIHDDLPDMDNDDYRRGQLTNHKVFGPALAILAGDALLTEAFGLLARAAQNANLPDGVGLAIIAEAGTRAGAKGMVGGQVKDIQAEGKRVTLEELEEIHRRKTGDLITFSIRAGAMVAGANSEQLEALTAYANRIGLAFQIQDDVLNVTGDDEMLGKPVGSDAEKEKATFPALLGIDASRERVRQLVSEAKEKIMDVPGLDPEHLIMIADYLIDRER